MASWTAADIPNQRGRTAIVTGATSGLGRITARDLARAGARVVLGVRDTGRGESVAEEIRAAAGASAQVEVERLDLAELASVRAFAEAVAERHEGLDLLVNNAGVMALPRTLSADGFEMQLATNHLGHFALTGLMLERLLARPEPRVVTVSSVFHRRGRIDFDDLHGERRYDRWRAYGQSKLANLLFAFELGRRAAAAGTTLTSVAAHPGYASTNLQLRGPEMEGSGLRTRAMVIANKLFAQSDERGALPSLYAATMPELVSGAYVGPDGPGEMRGSPQLVGASAAATDEATARRLWEVSEELTGVRFGFSGAT